MEWVTREHPKTDRIACPWLIRTFIDPDAEVVYLPAPDVLAYAEREGATSFDAPGANVASSMRSSARTAAGTSRGPPSSETRTVRGRPGAL